MKHIEYIALVMPFILSGCGIYANYKRPESLPVSDSLYRDAAVSPEDSSSFAYLSWRDLFTDPLLVSLIEAGLEKNADLQTAKLLSDEARESLLVARLAFLPSVTLAPQGQISSIDGEKPAKTYNLGGTLSWEVDAFGSLNNSKKGSRAAYEASVAYAQAVQTQLIATVAETYYSLVSLDKKLSITKETVGKWEENVRTMEALKRAGQATEAGVTQSKASLLEAKASVLSLEKDIKALENSLSVLVGAMPQSVERSDLFELDFGSNISVGVPAQLLSRRPDVRQKEALLAKAFYATNKARSAFYPNISLSGSAGWTNSAGAAISNPGNWLLTAVGALVQPVFNSGQNVANLNIAKAQQQEALLAFTQSLLDAGAEVNDALTQWQTACKMLGLDQSRTQNLQAAVKSTQLLMRRGSTNYLEVLTAQQTLLQSQLSEVEDKYSEIEAVIELYHALGGGCD